MTHYLDCSIDLNSPEFADAYDELPVWSAPFGMMLLNEIPLPVSGRALDLGCGTGFPLTTLAARLGAGVEVTGLEPWETATQRAERRIQSMGLSNATVLRGDAQQIPFEDNHFDLVTANLLLNNLAEPERMMQEAWRVLKPGGHLCITTNLQGTFAEIYTLLTEAMAHLGEPEALHNLAKQAASRRNVPQVEDLFYRAGFRNLYKVENNSRMRWANGTAFFNDPFIVMAFLPGWKNCIPQIHQKKAFAFVERTMNAHAQESKGVPLTLPMLYIEGQKKA